MFPLRHVNEANEQKGYTYKLMIIARVTERL